MTISLRFRRQTDEDTTWKNRNERSIIRPSVCQGHSRATDAETLDILRAHDISQRKGLWAKVPADGTATVMKPHLAGQRDGKNIWEDEKKAVPNKELKGMVEFYKAAGRDSGPRSSGPEL